MRFFIVAAALVLAGCSAPDHDEKPVVKEVYTIKALSALTTCIMEHSECPDVNERCVESPEDSGRTRQCIHRDKLGEYFACTAGDMIVHPMEPYLLRCL